MTSDFMVPLSIFFIAVNIAAIILSYASLKKMQKTVDQYKWLYEDERRLKLIAYDLLDKREDK